MSKQDLEFSVCIPVYYKEKVDNLRACLNSMVKQTILPNEILLLTDDPSSDEVDQVINEYKRSYPGLFKEYALPRGSGIGKLSRLGVEKSEYDLIARMDSDDIALPDRFEKQLKCFAEDEELSIVGGDIAEFYGNTDNIIGYRNVPCSDKDCKRFLKTRNPFNHMTVMFRKSHVIKAGNYAEFLPFYEDYYLWVSMNISGCRFKNIGSVLVYARTGTAMYSRRGGLKVFKYDYLVSKYKYQNGLTNIHEFFLNVISRFIVLVLMPNRVRGFIYENLLRHN